jgi:putative FmdB family regulatory protein
MPIYAYKCKDCGAQFELLVGVTSDSNEIRCEKCGSKNLERLLSTFGLGSSSSSSSACTTFT